MFGSCILAAVLYVAPTGNDANPGTREAPLATVTGARNAVRQKSVKAGSEIVFLKGRYPQLAPTEFTAIDSGSEQAPVLYRAEKGAEVRISGGIPLSGWTRDAKGRYTLSLKQCYPAITDYGKEPMGTSSRPASGAFLVYDDARMVLPRWPKQGFLRVASVVTNDTFTYADERVSSWASEKDPRGQGWWAHDWASAAIAFQTLDPATKTIQQKKPGSSYGFRKNGFWFGYNLLCELSEPGEYYLDRTDGMLYFLPPDNTPGRTAELAIGKELITFNAASNIVFEGFIFENCRAEALQLREGRNITIRRSIIRNTGYKGITIRNGEAHRIAGCELYHLNDGGIDANAGAMNTLQPCNHVFDNNHIYDYSRFCLSYGAAISIYGCGFTLSHNLIHNGPHVGILFHGRENQFLFNEVHSVCLQSGEMGAFYAGRDWTLVGNIIQGNYIHDIYNPRPQRNRAIMLDDGAGGIVMQNNLIVNVAEGISLSSYFNTIENNAFVNCHPAISGWQTYLTPASVTPPRGVHAQMPERLFALNPSQPPWSTKYPELLMLANAITNQTQRPPQTRTRVIQNLTWNCTGPLVDHAKNYPYSADAWLITNNLVNADPHFIDPAKMNFRLASDSPAVRDGFKPLPIAQMGLYPSKERACWPVNNALTLVSTNLLSTPK